MKKIDVVNLIRAHVTLDEPAFRKLANQIAADFYDAGDVDIAQYISSLLTTGLGFVPQNSETVSSRFLAKDTHNPDTVYWPESIAADMRGVYNALSKKAGVNKFLFYGPSGTGKTESARILAKRLNRELWIVNFSELVDYKLGETPKNIAELFRSISKCRTPQSVIYLFDEIDSIALNRISSFDLREMGRATSAFLKGMDELPPEVAIIATTNLFDEIDDALKRRFDALIDFSRYDYEDLREIYLNLYDSFSKQFGVDGDAEIFSKILRASSVSLMPGQMKNTIKSCFAFTDDKDQMDHLRYLLTYLCQIKGDKAQFLRDHGFSIRQIAALLGQSKSTVQRKVS